MNFYEVTDQLFIMEHYSDRSYLVGRKVDDTTAKAVYAVGSVPESVLYRTFRYHPYAQVDPVSRLIPDMTAHEIERIIFAVKGQRFVGLRDAFSGDEITALLNLPQRQYNALPQYIRAALIAEVDLRYEEHDRGER